MKKSLLSVSPLTKDNNVVVEFDSTSCLIKDKASGLVLLRGMLRNGLYQLELAFDLVVPMSKTIDSLKTSNIAVNLSSKIVGITSSSSNKATKQHLIVLDLPLNVNVAQTNCIGQQWRAKLGHPTFHVLKHVLNKIQIDCSKSAIPFYDSCKIGKSHQLLFENCPITAK